MRTTHGRPLPACLIIRRLVVVICFHSGGEWREPFWVPVDPQVRIACYRRLVDRQAKTLVHFHGNGEAVADYLPWMAEELELLGYNSLFVEYREYGESTGKLNWPPCSAMAPRCLMPPMLDPRQAVAFGRSMGSLYAIELARRHPTLGGLILESGIADPAERFLCMPIPRTRDQPSRKWCARSLASSTTRKNSPPTPAPSSFCTPSMTNWSIFRMPKGIIAGPLIPGRSSSAFLTAITTRFSIAIATSI